MNGKSIIDYMIEARMYYLLDNDKHNVVRNICKKPRNIALMANYDLKHNMLFMRDDICSLAKNH
jgi:hypothetical protein